MKKQVLITAGMAAGFAMFINGQSGDAAEIVLKYGAFGSGKHHSQLEARVLFAKR